MNEIARLALGSGSLAMALAVALGAFGAHGLKARLGPELLAAWKTGVDYQVYHALGLLLLGLLAQVLPGLPGTRLAALLMLAGIALFSGSLYALALTGLRPLGMLTPLGGLCFIAAWAVMAWNLLRA